MSNLITNHNNDCRMYVSMRSFFENEYRFGVGDWEFFFQDKDLYVTGGFIDLSKEKSFYVRNPFQVVAAASSKNCVNVLVSQERDSENDVIEIPLDFSNHSCWIEREEW